MHKIIPFSSKLNNYSVEFVDNLSSVEALIDAPNTVTVIDSNVHELYPTLYRPDNVIVGSVESNKTLERADRLLQKMISLGVKSNTTVVVIGGGILQDLVGFCCSIYHRGIPYILVPTTLLAQADSCIGGKTSINFGNKKNILGTFHPPEKVVIHTGFLRTLKDVEYISGLGEIYKFAILQNKMDGFGRALSMTDEDDVIYDSLMFKKHIIEIDEFDKKERKFLNFGHTFGHAFEFTSNNEIPHGVGVIIGSLMSCVISKAMGYNVPNFELIVYYANTMLSNVTLKQEWFDFESILEAVKLDKKNTGKIVDVLINDEPVLTNLEDMSIIKEALTDTFALVSNQ